MENNIYKVFLEKNNFNEVKKLYWQTFNERFEESREMILFRDFDKSIYNEYMKNRDQIVESYFLNFKKDIENRKIDINEYQALSVLEDSFDQSQSEYFAEYFLGFIKCLREAFENGLYNEEIFNFIWCTFDRIFHEGFHLEESSFQEYEMELNKLKKIIEEIDVEDEHLIKQKIEQFI